jgi:hypothetical protein
MQLIKGVTVILALFSPGAAAHAGNWASTWTFVAGDGGASAGALSNDGAVHIEIRCNTQTQAAVVTLGALGAAFNREAGRTLILKVRHATGFVQTFPVATYFYDQEGGVIQTEPLSPFFLQAFSADGVLTVENGRGIKLGTWRLEGTMQTRQMLRTVCLV